jgi:hypothetical protein
VLLEIDKSAETKAMVAEKLTHVFRGVPPALRKQNVDRFPRILSANVMDAIPFEPKIDGPILSEVIKEIAGSNGSWNPQLYPQLAQFSDDALHAHFLAVTLLTSDRSDETRAQRRGQPARRWVVERSHSWFNRFRKLLVRYKKKQANYLALTHCAAAIICFRMP